MSNAKVFIAGSRAISRLTKAVQQRLDRIIAAGHAVIVGDANGADKAVQRYFAERRYPHVVVYFAGLRFRNNVGEWPTRPIAPPAGVRGGFEFYAAKDRAMARDATHGLMLWDGVSRGTFANISALVADRKPVVVYLDENESFLNVKNQSDIDELIARAKVSANST